MNRIPTSGPQVETVPWRALFCDRNSIASMIKRSKSQPSARRVSKRWEKLFLFASYCALSLCFGLLLWMVATILATGWSRLTVEFLTSYPSRFAQKAGLLPALVGTLWVAISGMLFAAPIGIGAAVYLEEYATPSRLTRLLEVNIGNLAGIPSILYGMLGLQFFVRWCGLGRSILAGGLTMGLLVLPIVVIVSREAIRNVPNSLREAALALGATKWQMVRTQVLPNATPGIMTGCIFALSRICGETAPLLVIGALAYIAYVPTDWSSAFTTIPIQMFNWLSRPQEAFHQNAAASIVVLLVVLGALNSVAVYVRARSQRRARW